MSVDCKIAATGVFIDFVIRDAKMERILVSRTEFENIERKCLNEAVRFAVPRKPCGPHLHWHPAGIPPAAASPRIHQQVTEPPGTRSVSEPQPHKPDFVAATHPERGVNFVESLHPMKKIIALCRGLQ